MMLKYVNFVYVIYITLYIYLYCYYTYNNKDTVKISQVWIIIERIEKFLNKLNSIF